MASFKITMKDGLEINFPHKGRAGGSYTKKLRYEPGFVVITDEWDDEVSFPSADISKITKTA